MTTPAQLWGTVSVRDHLRRNAFVAELVLFDTLVVPCPPAGANWPADWDAAGQEHILGWIPDDRLMRVSWDDTHRSEWQKRQAASGTQFDIANLQEWDGLEAAQETGDFDALAYHQTRVVLQNHVDARRAIAHLKGMPQAPVAVIPAYDGPQAFLDDAPGQEVLLRAFGWDFLVPHETAADGTSRSHEDQIKAALDLAQMPEVTAHRDALRAWTSIEALKGTTTSEARDKMEALVADYVTAVAKSKIPVRLKWGIGLAEVAGAAAALALSPAFALLGPALNPGGLATEAAQKKAAQVPDKVKPAGLIHAIRAEFQKTPVAGLAVPDSPKTGIEAHWPNSGPALFL